MKLDLRLVDRGSEPFDLTEELGNGRVYEAEDVSIACVEDGIEPGRHLVVFRLDTPDGSVVLGQTSLANYIAAGSAFISRYGHPNRPSEGGQQVHFIQQMHERQHQNMGPAEAKAFVAQYLDNWKENAPNDSDLAQFVQFMVDHACHQCLDAVTRALEGKSSEAEGLSEQEKRVTALADAITKATPDEWTNPQAN